MKHYTPEQIRSAEEILFNAEQTARLVLVDAAYQVEQLSQRLEAEERLRIAAQAFVDDIKRCYPEGLAALDGVRPYVEALITALAVGDVAMAGEQD